MTGQDPALSGSRPSEEGHKAIASPPEMAGSPRATCDENCPKGIQFIEGVSGVSGELHIPGYGVLRAWCGASYEAGGLAACKKELEYLLFREWDRAGCPGWSMLHDE